MIYSLCISLAALALRSLLVARLFANSIRGFSLICSFETKWMFCLLKMLIDGELSMLGLCIDGPKFSFLMTVLTSVGSSIALEVKGFTYASTSFDVV